MREVTARIWGQNSEVLNQYHLLSTTTAKRCPIADEQYYDFDRIVVDIYDKDIDFNFVKIHLLSHFREHVQYFENI